MARRSGSAIQEELYSPSSGSAREELDDARLLDLDAEKESPFLRAQKRVSVRRNPLPKKTARRLLWAVIAVILAGLAFVAAAALYHYSEHAARFRLDSSDNIELAGLSNVTRAQIMEVMGGDIGRNIFFIPLNRRQKQLEQIPWVQSASVMRFAPNRIKIQIYERTPVAFARLGSRVMLIDAGGVLMDLTSKKRYSFPLIAGISTSEPLTTRAAQMKIYNELVRQLDSGGARYSQDLSEVDLGDPEDVRVLTNDRDGAVLVHLGSSNYLERFKIYAANLRAWRQQFSKLDSVDLRYDRQIIVNPDLNGTPRQAPLSAAATKAVISAGVKPTALISREPVRPARNPKATTVSSKKNVPKSRAAQIARKPARARTRTSKRETHGHEHTAVTRHRASSPGGTHASAAIRLRTSSTLRKPSPAIAKRQENP
ncbi:MAG TPA: FtsQ-type POTRA domain-containing protein [Terriglobales bacterium]|jgi:cell division protein FtsQ